MAKGEQRQCMVSDEGRLIAGRYRLVERIGSGGMGTVWRAQDELLGRDVALKRLHIRPHLADDELATLYERTRREARSAARITHPHVVVVHDVVDDDGLPCIVMEHVPSRTLGDVLKQDGPVTPDEAARIGRGMIAALRAAHAAGVLHRDVKPGNVLLGEEGRVVLTDFGIAVASGTSTLTKTGELVGSIDYVAPERVRGGTPGPASDLWALGATLYQAVEGRPPFRKPTAIETAYAIAVDPLEPMVKGGSLAPLVEQLLAKEPEKRPSAEEVERRLREPLADIATTALDRAEVRSALVDRRTGLSAPPPPPAGSRRTAQATTPPADAGGGRRRGRAAWWAAGAVVLAAALTGTLLALSGGRDNKHVTGSRPTASASATSSPSASDSRAHPVPPVPKGYRLVKEKGVSFPVPDGWTRTVLPESDETNEIGYIGTSGLVSLRVGVLDHAATDLLKHLQDDEVKSLEEGKLSGYRELRMERTVYRDIPAAYWEFTFQGRAREYRAADLVFGRPGKLQYTVYLSAPSAEWAGNKQVFDNVLAGLRLPEQTP